LASYTKEIVQQNSKITRCPECNSDSLIKDYDRGEVICRNCGLVITQEMLDRGPEWRAFTNEEKERRCRVGIPNSFSMYDKGLLTVIDQINRDAHGKILSISARLKMQNLKKWHFRTRFHSSVEKNLAQAMGELDRLTDNLHIPSQVKERAAVIYRKALDSGLVRGRSIAAIAAAALYAACRATETPRTLKEVAITNNAKRKDIARYYRLLIRELDIKMPVDDPIRCVSKIASKARIPIKTQRTAINILEEAKKRGIVSGKDPMGLSASALYLACLLDDTKKSQKRIAEVANVTEVTVRNRYQGLKKALKLSIEKGDFKR
jgi:transcription initiation factor TFIIB